MKNSEIPQKGSDQSALGNRIRWCLQISRLGPLYRGQGMGNSYDLP